MLGVFGKGVDGAGLDQKSQKNSLKINLNILFFFCITLIIYYYYSTKYIYIYCFTFLYKTFILFFIFFHINKFYYNFSNFLKSTPLPNMAYIVSLKHTTSYQTAGMKLDCHA
jgi:hypothetical protein